MRMLTIVLPQWCCKSPGKHKPKTQSILVAGGYVDTKHGKVGKDYYVVHKDQSDKCSIVTGDWAKKPEGAIGGAPYASKNYAKAALKKFPECKGGETDEAADQ
jgi:hypothetical protein